MNHLTDDLLYTLATKVAEEGELTTEEEAALKHTTRCDACYHLLCCMMALQDAARNFGAYAAAKTAAPVRQTVTAVLKLAVDRIHGALEQLDQGSGGWIFRPAPMALAGARSAKKRTSPVEKLTEEGSSRTFVTYDPDKQLLVIQLDANTCPTTPHVFLKASDGSLTRIPLERVADLYWAQVRDLAEGDYEIILEK